MNKPHRCIRAVWDRFSNTGEMENVSLDVVKEFVQQRGLGVESIEDVEFGFNSKLKAIRLDTGSGSALYPRQKLENIEIFQRNIAPTKNAELFWNSVDWFAPAFLAHTVVDQALDISGLKIRESSHLNNSYLQKRFEQALSSIYTLGNIVPITVQTLTDSIAIGKHLPIIKESILAFYSGMKVAAIAALIPIIEDALSSIIGKGGSDLDLIAKVNKAIDLANDNIVKLHIENVSWIPPEYIEISTLKVLNKRIFILETIRHWLINSFYSKTETGSS